VSEQYERALEILRGKRSVLDRGAAVLLEKEKIDGEYLRALMGTEARNLPEKAPAENVQ
jgi:ATP-dependent Zn protease